MSNTLADTVAFILSDASSGDLERVIGAVNDRRKTLASVRAAQVQKGANVKLTGLSPKYLNGLSGTVGEITGKHAPIILDEESTERLCYTNQRRFNVPLGAKTYTIPGIPLSCFVLTEA